MFQKRTLNSISSFFFFMAILIGPVPLVLHDSSELPTLANAIDPSISWNTFLGGAGGYDSGFDIFVDGSGNIYVAGTSSPTYIGNPTWGVPIRAYSSGNGDDVFVAKLNSSGILIWNTFLGGSGSDNASGIVVDQDGNLYVTGSSSANWGTPTQPHDGSASDGFIAKLDNSGVLIWHTFLGSGYLTGIDLDAAGNIYLTGTTADSLNIPGNPINPHSGSSDAFVVKMTSSGNLSWYTFLGGTAVDRASEISVGKYGNIYIVGTSYAAWGSPVLPYQAGFWDPFVAKLDPSGTLDWNTFLGAGKDEGESITVDKNENVYVAGTSSSTWGNPVRAFEYTPPFSTNSFTAKLNSAGTLIYNTFLGNGTDESSGIAVDDSGYTYVTGDSCSPWGSPFQEAASACTDAFIAKLDNSGNLVANGFLGGSGFDFGGNVFVSGNGDVHMIGMSEESWGNPVRSFSKDFDSSTVDKDAFVAKLAMPILLPVSSSFSDVLTRHPYFTDIEILYANGLTAGCSSSPLLFCPDTVMDRAQSAVFMLRGNLGVNYVPPNPPFGSTFGDYWGPGPWAQKWAQGMLQQGLTAGCSSSPLLYCPWEAMPRLQAAVFGMRLMNGNAYVPPAATGTVFADLTDTSLWYTKWAEQAYLNGLLPACGSSGGKPLFCPNDLVSRGLGAYMIVRAKNLSMP